MGDTKTNMTPKKDSSKGVFSRFASRKGGKPGSAPAKTDQEMYADYVADAHITLGKLISGKQADLKSEKGQEEYNTLAIARLNAMNYHLESIMDLCGEYANS